MTARPFVYWSGSIAVLGTFLQNYATSVIAGVLCFACDEFHLSAAQTGLLAGMILLGGLVGALAAGALADRLGRRETLFIAAIFYAVCNIPFLFVSSYPLLLVLRFGTGLAAGITSLIVPLYLAEIAPPSQRGAFVTASALCAALGLLIAYLVNFLCADAKDWRSMLFVIAIPATIQAVALRFVAESPLWFVRQGKPEEGACVMKSLHSETNLPQKGEEKKTAHHWRSLFNTRFRKGLWIGIALVVFQQTSSINAIVSYAHSIFQKTGGNRGMSTMVLALFLGIVNFVSAAISLFLIDRVGRRKLLLFSQAGVVFGLALLLVRSLFPAPAFFPLLALVVFLFTYSLGLGPIPWVLISEIYPLSIRASAIASMTFLSWLSTFTVVFTFPYFLSSIGATWTFLAYFLLSFGGFFFFRKIIPETKGKSLSEIDRSLYS